MKYKCLNTNNKITRMQFLKLPARIYDKDKNPQNKTVEKQILEGTHVLSNDFSVFPFVMTDENRKPICRCLLTCYENDPIGYVGFFEAMECQNAVDQMMVYVSRKAKDMGKTKLCGPINSSIYIGYRFKTDRFDKTYTSEPYNKEYYASMWEKCGFMVSDKYVSNQLKRIDSSYESEQMKRIYDRYLARGYQIISPTKDILEECLRDIYNLMMETFVNFVGYKKITEEQFIEMFLGLGEIARMDMIKLAYDNNLDLKAFSIALPNYYDIGLGKPSLKKLIAARNIQKQPDEYVILYAGASKSTVGLGCAVSYATIDEMRKQNVSSIGALIHEGNMTGRIYDELYTDIFHYVLLTKNLTPGGNS